MIAASGFHGRSGRDVARDRREAWEADKPGRVEAAWALKLETNERKIKGT